MIKRRLSGKQHEIVAFIKKQIIERGYPPSVREIGEAVGLKSTSSVHSQLEKLERYGYIRRDPTKSRTIEVLDEDFENTRVSTIKVPLLGTVAAGVPMFAEQNIEGYFPLSASILPRNVDASEVFILKVRGQSMINIGIMDGDFVFVHSCNTAENGSIVVALVDDSATVKTFYREKDHIRLQPQNDDMEPIIVKDCKILGQVFGRMGFWR